jgi:hypothetical protein
MNKHPLIVQLRKVYHRSLCQSVIFNKGKGIPSIADTGSKLSCKIAIKLISLMGLSPCIQSIKGQTAGGEFERLTRIFVRDAFTELNHLRPGDWNFLVHGDITKFDQYKHLAQIAKLIQENKELRAAMGDYLIVPDIVISRSPIDDEEINRHQKIVADDDLARFTPLRARNSSEPSLHASISCKLTLRSDRSQNARTEGLNLIRNRKGHAPHIAVVTGEPLPSRIASLAFGTGDIDCVYHIALLELRRALSELSESSAADTLDLMTDGRRLRDISDLPFDLAI